MQTLLKFVKASCWHWSRPTSVEAPQLSGDFFAIVAPLFTLLLESLMPIAKRPVRFVRCAPSTGCRTPQFMVSGPICSNAAQIPITRSGAIMVDVASKSACVGSPSVIFLQIWAICHLLAQRSNAERMARDMVRTIATGLRAANNNATAAVIVWFRFTVRL